MVLVTAPIHASILPTHTSRKLETDKRSMKMIYNTVSFLFDITRWWSYSGVRRGDVWGLVFNRLSVRKVYAALA